MLAQLLRWGLMCVVCARGWASVLLLGFSGSLERVFSRLSVGVCVGAGCGLFWAHQGTS